MKLIHAKIKRARKTPKPKTAWDDPWSHPQGIDGYRAEMGLPPLNNDQERPLFADWQPMGTIYLNDPRPVKGSSDE